MPLDPLDFGSPELIAAFRQNLNVPAMAAGFAGMLAGGAAFVGLTVPAVSRIILPKPQETRLADNLPFEAMAKDNKTILCRDGTIMQMIEVAGRDVTFFSPEERESYHDSRKNWIDALAESDITIRVFVIRDKVPVYMENQHEKPILREMADRWNKSFQESFRNRQVIVLSRTGKGKDAMTKLDDAMEVSLSILDKYSPKVMTQDDPNENSRPLSVWGRIISPVTRPQPGGTGHNLADVLTADHAFFAGENGAIKFKSGNEELYCSAIGFRKLGDYTDESFATEIASLPFELIVLNNIIPMSRAKASVALAHASRMALASRFSPSVAEQFAIAQDLIEGNAEYAACLTEYAQYIFAFGKTREEVAACEKEIKRVANTYGMTPVREGAAGHAAWFSQFPGFQTWPRSFRIFAHNVADQITLDRPPEGLPRSDWGEGPIAYFRTATGSAYQFQFHVSMDTAAVAHATTIGPTGGGKTTLITFLSAMAMRHPKLRVYMIDRFGGAYIFTKAVGGKYATFAGSTMKGSQSALNPFQMSDTPENRAFLRNFLQAIADVDDSDSLEEIGFAVEAIYETPGLPKEKRSLAAVYDAVFSKGKPLRKKLQKWVEPSMLGEVFNAPEDTLDLESNRLVTLDFTKIYENDDVARAVILYLMHRIQSSISELKCPALIFIDETEPVVQHPMFRKFYLQMLQEYRKKGAAVISAFQRPEAITQAGLGEAIRGQAQTTFFLPNPQAQPDEYKDWSLTDREWDYIKGNMGISRKLPRSVLVKRATGESVILDVNLQPLGEYLNIFRSDEASKAKADEMMDVYGDNWLEYYLKK